MAKEFINILKDSRLVNVIKEEKHMDKITKSSSNVVFLLTGNIANLKTYVDYIKSMNKLVLIHVEMIGGLNNDKDGLAFIGRYIKPDGIISTKKKIIQLAKNYKLLTVQRIFAIDTDAVNHSIRNINSAMPDVAEIMPARMPEIIKHINASVNVPVIAGGLIKSKEHIDAALSAGAIAAASGTPSLWEENINDRKESNII